MSDELEDGKPVSRCSCVILVDSEWHREPNLVIRYADELGPFEGTVHTDECLGVDVIDVHFSAQERPFVEAGRNITLSLLRCETDDDCHRSDIPEMLAERFGVEFERL